MPDERILAGVLEGVQEVKLVVVRMGLAEVLLSPQFFPSERWIQDHVGSWVHVVTQDKKKSAKSARELTPHRS